MGGNRLKINTPRLVSEGTRSRGRPGALLLLMLMPALYLLGLADKFFLLFDVLTGMLLQGLCQACIFCIIN